MTMRSLALLPITLTVLLAACASTPDALEGEFSGLRPTTATAADTGKRVRWGGRLLEVRPERDRTCFEILSLPLRSNGRPDTDAVPGRRFLACRDGFADPAAFPEDRNITVTGELIGFSSRSIGEYEYRFPRVQARAVHLWPEVRERAPYPVMMPWWHDPYFYGGPRYRYWY